MNNKECDYCSNYVVFLEQYEAGEDYVRSLDIVFYPEFRHIQVQIKDDKGIQHNYGIEKRINYCPYCGKKLEVKTN